VTRALMGSYTPGGATPAQRRVAQTPMRHTDILAEALQVLSLNRPET